MRGEKNNIAKTCCSPVACLLLAGQCKKKSFNFSCYYNIAARCWYKCNGNAFVKMMITSWIRCHGRHFMKRLIKRVVNAYVKECTAWSAYWKQGIADIKRKMSFISRKEEYAICCNQLALKRQAVSQEVAIGEWLFAIEIVWLSKGTWGEYE